MSHAQQRLQQQLADRKTEYNRKNEKLRLIRSSLDRETDPSIKFKLHHDWQEIQNELEHLAPEIDRIETQLASLSHTTSGLGGIGKSQIGRPRNTMLIIVNRLAIILGTLAFLAVIVALVMGKIAPGQLAFTNVLGYVAYYTSLFVCCIEIYALIAYRQWIWMVSFLAVGAAICLLSIFFVFESWIYVADTLVPLVLILGRFYTSQRTSAMKP